MNLILIHLIACRICLSVVFKIALTSLLLLFLQAIQKNNLTLVSGISLKKKGEDEVSVCLCPEKNAKTLMLVVCMPVNQLV